MRTADRRARGISMTSTDHHVTPSFGDSTLNSASVVRSGNVLLTLGSRSGRSTSAQRMPAARISPGHNQPVSLANQPALAATAHDPTGAYMAGLGPSASALRTLFEGCAVVVTEPTSDDVVTFLTREIGANITRRPADGNVGRHRRAAVELAQSFDAAAILYSDLDHILRWIGTDAAELTSLLSGDHPDLLVIGRSAQAMAACPARLRDTETIVNHIYALATGRAWDLMFATRLMSPRAADVVVSQGREDSMANDVEWPLLVESAGFSVGYKAADGLSYRIAQDFGADADAHDSDPMAWVKRVEIAHGHAQVIGRYLVQKSSASASCAARTSPTRPPTPAAPAIVK